MTSGLTYLIAARRCEVDELEQLARTSALVTAIARLVHALQRERGLSNVLLASGGGRFAAQRAAQVGASLGFERALRTAFGHIQAAAQRNGARLFTRIAWVVSGLDALPALRARIGALDIAPSAATGAYVKLIAGLLAVVFEAADGASDPEISRALTAMFNFMQGKEYSGQERACGAAAFTAGVLDADAQRHWLQLIAAQERCFGVFADFADPALATAWQQCQPLAELAEVERLRRIACAAAPGVALDADLGGIWFDCCSLRIDAMQQVEEQVTAALRALCERRIAEARSEAEAHGELLHRLASSPADPLPTALDELDAVFPAAVDGGADTAYGPRLERSIVAMLHEQSRRLQAITDELDAVRATLNERKLVERAKGLLMAHRRLSEDEAHRMLRQTAMAQNRRLVEVAESVLLMADYLPQGA